MNKNKILLLVLLLLALIWGGLQLEEVFFPSPGLEVHFMDVGQGDAILLVSPEGRSLLVDGGEFHMGDDVLAYLDELNIEELDIIVATHPHSDHIGGLIRVMEELPVGQVYDSGRMHTTQTMLSYLETIENKDIHFQVVSQGYSFQLGEEVKIFVLSPWDDLLQEEINAASIVLLVKYRDFTMLLTGDATALVEEGLLERGQLEPLHILKVAHHGSRTSTTEFFLSATRPDIAIISAGVGNRYGHPHEIVLERLKEYGVKIFRTDWHGSIVIWTDGYDIEVFLEKAEELYEQ